MNNFFKNLVKVSIIILIFANFFFGETKEKQPPKASPNTPATAVPIDVFKVEAPHNIEVDLKYPARAKNFNKVTIFARVEGILEKKMFQEGDLVKEGDLLYKIEPDIYEATVQMERANVDIALANFNDSQRNWERVEALYNDNATSKEKRDSALYQFQKAKATLSSAQAALKKAEIQLKYTDIKSPITGYTRLNFVDVGNLVRAGTPLIDIVQIDPLYVEFSLPDSEFKNYQIQKKGKLSVELLTDGKVFKNRGEIDFKDYNIDEGTSSVKVRAVFPNRESEILPGDFLRVSIKGILLENKIEIPQKAVIQNELGKIVFVVKDGKVTPAPIKTGESRGEYIIVESGLNTGDTVVVNNFFRLRPGANVKIDKTVNSK